MNCANIVIIPTYNEKENIEAIIHEVFALPLMTHVLVVDDNSPDGTGEIVERLRSKFAGQLHLLSRAGKEGLGRAYLAGFAWCLEHDYEYICEMDADFSHAPKDLVRLIKACEEGADLAIGSRYISGVNVVNWPLSRVLLSYGASMYVRLITAMKINDTTAGFVCYRRHVLERIDLEHIRFVGYAFQIEMKYLAHRLGAQIVEVPIIFVNRTLGESKMSGSIFKEALFGVLRLRWDSLRNTPFTR